MRDDFAVFIYQRGRPDNIKTLRAKKGNYTGNWYRLRRFRYLHYGV